MKQFAGIILCCCTSIAFADLSLNSSAFNNSNYIPYKYAQCKSDGHGYTLPSNNISPPLSWKGVPAGTKSFVLLMSDKDIPEKSAIKDVNQKFPANFPRVMGYHWMLIDIPSTVTKLPEKAGTQVSGRTRYGIQGVNYFSRMGGADIGGYTGPCPPVNDAILHNYVFTLFALDKSSLGLSADGNFSSDDILKAMQGHILGQAILIGKYTTQSSVKKDV